MIRRTGFAGLAFAVLVVATGIGGVLAADTTTQLSTTDRTAGPEDPGDGDQPDANLTDRL